jgi:predicted nucleic acid-binding protein
VTTPATAICNAGPLIALGKLNRLDLLVNLYRIVYLPEAVYDEVVRFGLTRGEPDAQIVQRFWRRQQWPIVPVPETELIKVNPSAILGRGEYAVLALALTHDHVEVLMDDAVARAEARRLGLHVRGTLGILVQAYRQRHLSMPQIELLIEEIVARPDIWISTQLCQQVLTQIRRGEESDI